MNDINKRLSVLFNEKLKLTAPKVGQRLGVSRQLIYNYTTGTVKKGKKTYQEPSFSVLVKIINEFNVEPRWLMKGKGEIFANSDIGTLTDQLHNMKDMIYKLRERIEVLERPAEIEIQARPLSQNGV